VIVYSRIISRSQEAKKCLILEVEGDLLKAAQHRKRAAGALQLATPPIFIKRNHRTMAEPAKQKLWGGRFTGKTDPL
jgi:hypothetical protein